MTKREEELWAWLMPLTWNKSVVLTGFLATPLSGYELNPVQDYGVEP